MENIEIRHIFQTRLDGSDKRRTIISGSRTVRLEYPMSSPEMRLTDPNGGVHICRPYRTGNVLITDHYSIILGVWHYKWMINGVIIEDGFFEIIFDNLHLGN